MGSISRWVVWRVMSVSRKAIMALFSSFTSTYSTEPGTKKRSERTSCTSNSSADRLSKSGRTFECHDSALSNVEPSLWAHLHAAIIHGETKLRGGRGQKETFFNNDQRPTNSATIGGNIDRLMLLSRDVGNGKTLLVTPQAIMNYLIAIHRHKNRNVSWRKVCEGMCVCEYVLSRTNKVFTWTTKHTKLPRKLLRLVMKTQNSAV